MKTGTAKLLLIILLTLSLLQFGNQNNQAIPANSISNQLAGAMSSFRTFPELSWSIDHDHESTFQYADFIAPTATADILGGKWQTRSLSPNLLESSSWSWDLSAVGSSLSLTTTFATVAYVYAGDTNDANAFKDLLDGKGYVTDLMTLAQAIPGAFDDYDLIILADDTGWNNDWGMDITQINAINDSGKPILGLGEGGYAYFGQIDLEIGSTRPGNQGVHGNDGTIEVVNSTHPIFTSPTPITSAEPIDLYKSTRFVSTHFSSYPEDVDLLGKIPSSDHYPLLLEDDRYLLWGFREPPNGKMNQVGKDLFLNIVAYLSGVQFIDPIYIDEDSDFAAYGFPGDGSESNPYVIENYNIFNSTATLIHVENTTVHFEIRDNNLNGIDGSNDGIFLSRVVNGTISSNTIFNCQTGINLFHSHDNTITNNYITNNFGHGIFLDGSGSNTIDYNTISESGASTLIAGGTPSLLAAGSFGHGIYLDPSNENTITYNDIHDNSGSGVFLENSNQNVITVNAIHDNGEPEATLLMAAGSFGHGIYLDPSDHNEIIDNFVFDNLDTGIFLNDSDDTLITDNIVYQNDANGVLLLNASFNTIDNNTIGENGLSSGTSSALTARARTALAAGSFGHGIYLDPSNNNTITDNDVYGNGGSGVFLENSANNTISINEIHDNGEPVGSMLMAAGSFGHGIYLDPSDNNDITDNIVWGNLDTGIFLNDSDNTLVSDNFVLQNDANGIFLLDAEFNTIDNNTIGDNGLSGGTSSALTARARTALAAGSFGHGIYLDPSNNNTISNNNIYGNGGSGVFLESSSDNTISSNGIHDNGVATSTMLMAAGSFGHGIYLDPSNHNTIWNNTISNNGGSGIFLEDSDYNTIDNNTIAANGHLLASSRARSVLAAGSFGHGIYLDPSNHNNITNNVVLYNNDTGIFLNDSDDTRITDNFVFQNDANGIFLLNASENLIDSNTIADNGLVEKTLTSFSSRARSALAAGSFGHGIYLDPSNHNTINNNIILDNGGSGVYLEDSNDNTISSNAIRGNGETTSTMLMAAGSFGHGIYLDPSNRNTIWNNTISSNGGSGVFLEHSSYNTIDSNTIADNGQLLSSARLSHSILAAGSFGHGIYLDPSNHNTITNNDVSGSGSSGVYLEDSNDNTISSNAIHDNGVATSTMLMAAGSFSHGIYLDPSNRNTIWNNTIWKNGGSGVFLEDSDYNTIDNNTIAANGEVLGSTRLSRSVLAAGSFGHGIYLDPSNHNNITNNVVLDNPDTGIFLNDSDDTLISENFVQENGASGVFLLNSSSNTIDNNTITLNGEAPPASSARARSTLAAGSFGHGIYLDPSDENTISNNTVSNNYGNGIFLEDSSQVLISENFVQENGASGVFLIGSSFNVIDNNTITTNGVASSVAARGRSLFAAGSFGHGIYLDPSPNNTISNNVIDNNKGNGIFLEESGDIMTFRNEVSNNTLYGINVTLGSGENMIILNNFGGNNEGGTSQGNDDGFDNLFRYNHWNDHNNTDNDDDFLADDPYFIDGGANSSDSTAVAEVIDYSDHYLFGVNIVFPNYHDKVTETVTITWLPAIDTRWDPINYTLEYSPDAGKEWVFLDEVEGWNTTSYVWDISHFKSGSRYKLRINATCSEGLTVSDTSGKFEIFKVKKRGFPKPDNPAGADALLYLSNEMVSSRTPGWSFIILVLSVIGTLAVRQLRRSSKD